MIRLCFERLKGYADINQEDEFIGWLADNFDSRDYRFGGYVVKPMHERWTRGGSPMWNILLESDDCLDDLAANHWMIDGYAVHAYHRDAQRETKIDNSACRPASID